MPRRTRVYATAGSIEGELHTWFSHMPATVVRIKTQVIGNRFSAPPPPANQETKAIDGESMYEWGWEGKEWMRAFHESLGIRNKVVFAKRFLSHRWEGRGMVLALGQCQEKTTFGRCLGSKTMSDRRTHTLITLIQSPCPCLISTLHVCRSDNPLVPPLSEHYPPSTLPRWGANNGWNGMSSDKTSRKGRGKKKERRPIYCPAGNLLFR
jgi:hypothetical protein